MHRRHLGLLVLLGAIWGSSFLFFRVSAPVLGPLPVAWFRCVLAAAILLAMLPVDERSVLRDRSRQFLVLGVVNAAVPYALIAFAELTVTASVAAVLNATTPIFGVIVARMAFGDAVTRPKVIGLVLGVVGVAIVVGLSGIELSWSFAGAVIAALCASALYAIGTSYARARLTGIHPNTLAAGQLTGAAIGFAPLGLAGVPFAHVTLAAVASVVALAVLGTAVAYLIYFRLLASIGPTSTLTVTLIAPVFGVLWAAIFLGEGLPLAALPGAILIAVSVVLITGMRLRASAVPVTSAAPPAPRRTPSP